MAAPLALPRGPLFFQFTNLEQTAQGVDTNGSLLNNTDNCALCSHRPEGNWGIAQISTMRAGVPVLHAYCIAADTVRHEEHDAQSNTAGMLTLAPA